MLIQKDCQRTITTVFGDITYKRRYYKNKETGEKAYLADKAAGIQRYERIDAELKADIADLSTILSYQKTTQELKRNGANCNVSRQTVINTLRCIFKIISTPPTSLKLLIYPYPNFYHMIKSALKSHIFIPFINTFPLILVIIFKIKSVLFRGKLKGE